MKDIARRILKLATYKQNNDYGYDHWLNGLQNAYVHVMIGEGCRTWRDIYDNLKDWFNDDTKFEQGFAEDYNHKSVVLLKKYVREYTPIVMSTE